jgi:hypothetical protein
VTIKKSWQLTLLGGYGLLTLLLLLCWPAIFFFLFAGANGRDYRNHGRIAMALLLALLIGAVVAFVGSLWVNNGNLDALSHQDRVALNWLYGVAIVLPILALIYLLWAARSKNGCAPACEDPCDPCGDEKLLKECYVCDAAGVCALRSKEVKKNGVVTKVKYT